MLPEKQMQGLVKNKQKLIIGAVVIIALFVLWNVMGSGTSDTSPQPSAPLTPPKANQPMSGSSGAAAPAGPAMTAASPTSLPSTQPEMLQPKQAPVPVNSDIVRLQQSQTEYTSALNKLQMLKLQKDIDEAKTAIATAELNRMTAEKNIADLITTRQELAPPPVETPIVVPSASPAAQAANTLAEAQRLQAAPSIAPAPAPDFPYILASVAYGKKWSAVINAQGKLLSVSVGDTLPPDNSKVIKIDKQSVTLKKGTAIRVITITSSIS